MNMYQERILQETMSTIQNTYYIESPCLVY